MRAIRYGMTALLLGGLVACGGCAVFLVGAGAAIGAGTIAYATGELRAAEQVTMDRAWSATTGALDELKLKIISAKRDELSGIVIARTADDRKVEIRLKLRANDTTEFRIRVGPIGDEVLSRAIYDKIKSRF